LYTSIALIGAEQRHKSTTSHQFSDLETMNQGKVGLTITPWATHDEWEVVRDLVMARDIEAVKYIQVWGARVGRLPAGVETTHSLLVALTSVPHTPLSLATAVNRFLNHISHLAMNMWGLTKLHEAGSVLAVPEWLVELRHETTHGQMPGVTVLRAAVQFGLAWLDTHYWGEQSKGEVVEMVGQDQEEAQIHKLLECYMYLKVYQVWGTERMTELQKQEEVWTHLEGLWTVVRGNHRLESISVKQAVGLVKTELCNLCEGEEGVEMLADVLVREDLLVPEKDFLESLDGGEDVESQGEVNVPKQLVIIWSDFVHMVDKLVGSKILIEKLLERMKNTELTGREIAAAWVVILAEGMAGLSSNKVLSINKEQVDLDTLERWLDRPNLMVLQLCGILCEVAGVGDGRRGRVEHLVKVAVGGKVENTGVETGSNIYTESDLNGEEEDDKDESKAHTGWKLDTEHNWDNQRLGGWGDQTWDMLWVEGQWGEADVGADEVENEKVPKFEIGCIDWGSAKGPKNQSVSETPHFYSNTKGREDGGWNKRRLGMSRGSYYNRKRARDEG